jgi:hypothetical protein
VTEEERLAQSYLGVEALMNELRKVAAEYYVEPSSSAMLALEHQRLELWNQILATAKPADAPWADDEDEPMPLTPGDRRVWGAIIMAVILCWAAAGYEIVRRLA